jgi:hypothetical protein
VADFNRREEDHEIPRATCIGETAKALKVEHSSGEELWVPKSVICEASDVKELGDYGTLVIPQWFAKKENLF